MVIKGIENNVHYLIYFSGEGNGQFNAPTGVAVDAQDNILVADWGNSRIQVYFTFIVGCFLSHLQVFDQFGSFLSFVNTSGCKLYGPQVKILTLNKSYLLQSGLIITVKL